MLLATGIVLHIIMSSVKPAGWSRAFGYCRTNFLSGIAMIHCYLEERVIQQAIFVVMVIVEGTRTVGFE